MASSIDPNRPLSPSALAVAARQLLRAEQQPEGFVGWTMVALSSEFWRAQVAAVPPSRRLLLLPDGVQHMADCNPLDPQPKTCDACSLADLRAQAEALGYTVLVTDSSPRVLRTIVGGTVDAIVGVACLQVLEKALAKILSTGVPAMAVPLLSHADQPTRADTAWVREMIHLQQQAPGPNAPTYVYLLRTARQLFEREHLQRLLPPPITISDAPEDSQPSSSAAAGDPLTATARIASDFLAQGGKYARPFITLAAYDALTGGVGATAEGAQRLQQVPDAVRRVALSVETFHKASLVHDDIEDDDDFRYGEPALHRRYGLPVAVNVGDFLIGLGYRLVSQDIGALGAAVVGDILDRLAAAHLRLSEGQGAELVWRDARDKQLTPQDALNIYALKTAPAFEAALLCGVRCAMPLSDLETPLQQFAKHLGIAFQILNDLQDWQGDQDNKLSAGLDILGGRPTLLWALALKNLGPSDRRALCQLIAGTVPPPPRDTQQCLVRVEQLYHQAGVFQEAHQLVEKYRQQAARIADALEPAPLRHLLCYLVDHVVQCRTAGAQPETYPNGN